MHLELVTIGNELLLGATIDTNAAALGVALSAAGVEIAGRTTVGDQPDAIRDTVRGALERTGTVLTTGGLGPTRDDITKTVIADLLGRRLRLDRTVLTELEDRFRRLGRLPMPEINRTQALVPVGAEVLPNHRGTAPGLWIEDGNRLVIMLPGVPREMHGLLAEHVLPRLRERMGPASRVIRSSQLRTTGIAEAALAERLAPLEETIPPLTLAFLPSVHGVDLRLTAWRLAPEEADRLLEDATAQVRVACGPHWYGTGETDLAGVVLDRLVARGLTLAVAESCTGGLVGERVTAVPGASRAFLGGVIAYADSVKTGQLGVAEPVLEAHGAVSEEAVRAMAEGVRHRFHTSAAIAVTGVAGPGGGTPDKPVGTVWFAAAVERAVVAKHRVFPGDRLEIRARSAQAALDLLRRQL